MDEDIINPNYHACTYTWATYHRLQKLKLRYDERVKVLFEMDSTHQHHPYSLESLDLIGLFEMSHVWKFNNWNKSLIPQHQPALQLQLPFQNLTTILIQHCHKLKDDAADANEEENVASSTSSHQISTTSFLFPQLNGLRLAFLPCLRSFDDAGDTIHHQSQLSSATPRPTYKWLWKDRGNCEGTRRK
ncbi:hypothetical protein E3N88_02061 [Mikania micrantha]|uniref:Uncharacterized protein n=1 Tax=Mikania micrantha TaxID=192012 RepID=A0A5N6Q2T5_9ASTR|nr:hypothetical protein E3N88_02061 [Mikania micrantha]